MSGTSADGIDAVLAEISGSGRSLEARLIRHVARPFPPAVRDRILDACLHGTVAQVCELNFELGERFARVALEVIAQAGLEPSQVAGIGSHGQTVHHLPNARFPSTLQIGEPAVIAERTGITTVADFRVRDMAAGGQGAPLVPYADWVLLTDPKRPRIVQNIGGIANLTFLPAHATLGDLLAFDTGPGNMVIDAVVKVATNGRLGFDRDGRMASRGRVSCELMAEFMAHPFLRRLPPKTTGREEFGEGFLNRLQGSAKRLRLPPEDVVATATAFTSFSIVEAYERFIFPRIKPSEFATLQVILGGGGARNSTLRRFLQERLGTVAVLTHEDLGIDNSAKEALAFAILAHETLLGGPSNVPAATGARRAVVLGKIVPAGRLKAEL